MPPRALTLPDPLADRLRRGEPVLELEALEGAAAPARAPGAVLWLLDGRGDVLGTAIADPENGLLRLLAREALPALDTGFFEKRAREALELRRALGLAGERAAFRLLNAEGDGVSGFTADSYGPYTVLHAYSRALLAPGRLLARAILEIGSARGVVLKLRPRGGARPGRVTQEILGEEPPAKWIAYENDVPYEVHLLGGLNAGLFTDMREHRLRVGRLSSGRRVLNTFAYTGAFSVAAARHGAAAVTSVDLSSGVLKWARENFRLSGIDPDDPRYRFEACDMMRFLRREVREGGRQYDVIILDPPTYSEARKSAWSTKNDYPELIALACRLFPAAGGFLFAASNALAGTDLEKHLEEGLEAGGRSAAVLETGGLPPDYPTDPRYPRARYLRAALLWVR